LQRKLQGPIVDFTVTDMLLRQTNLHLAGANWQRSGGKGSKPKPLELPKKHVPRARPAGDDVAQRLRNLGLIPPGTD
jgi:hypothetical protein